MASKPKTREGRIFTGTGPAPNISGDWNPGRFLDHIRGRAEATIEILIGVAVLKKLGLVHQGQVVSSTGAVWQDWKGTARNKRAHRFPCNPTIGDKNIPDIPSSKRLQDALIEPLAITDFVTFEVNYADELFEHNGGIAAAVEAIEYVLNLQPPNQAIDVSVVQRGARLALAGYERTYPFVEALLLDRVNKESPLQMHARSAKIMQKPLAPTLNIEAIQDVADDFARLTGAIEPRRIKPEGIKQLADKLEQLSKG